MRLGLMVAGCKWGHLIHKMLGCRRVMHAHEVERLVH